MRSRSNKPAAGVATGGGSSTTKKKRKKPTIQGVEFDSNEEALFWRWLEDARRAGLVKSWRAHDAKDKWQLFPVERNPRTDRVIYRGHSYSPDFVVYFTALGWNTLVRDLWPVAFKNPGGKTASGGLLIDVKPGFSPYGNDSERLFSVNRKWLRQRFGLIVAKAVVSDIAEKTFGPSKTITGAKSRKFDESKTATAYVAAHDESQPKLF